MKRNRIKALAIDDDLGDAELLRRHLNDLDSFESELIHVSTPQEAHSLLRDTKVNVVFLDYCLGAESGLSFLKALRSSGDERIVIVITGQGSEYVAADLTFAGADGYIVKSDINATTLERVISRAQERWAERQANAGAARMYLQLAEYNMELSHTSRIDPLTQLLNRRAWDESVDLEHSRSIRHNNPYCILMADVDKFKLLNDSLGHQAGDQCLRAIAGALSNESRKTDVVGRFGGEEFIVLAPEICASQALVQAERLRSAIWNLNIDHPANDTADRVTISIGVAEGPDGDWQDVIKRADHALYVAKSEGRNRCIAWNESPVPECGEH